MSRHSSTTISVPRGDAPRPHADYFPHSDESREFVAVVTNKCTVNHIAFDRGATVMTFQTGENARASMHMSVESATALRDSLNEALLLARAVRDAPEVVAA